MKKGSLISTLKDIIIRGSWSTDKEGNIILEIDNGSRIVLNKKAAAE